MSKIRDMWDLTYDELVNKVNWPSWDELRNSTLVVLVASLIFAILIYLIDSGFGFTTKTFYQFFK
ncbi:MAG: preprotein translocase subunit SecE [Bacteroidota bacterium]|nr:preprotein translocase subunit SecE [Bacteroidota bacterium]